MNPHARSPTSRCNTLLLKAKLASLEEHNQREFVHRVFVIAAILALAGGAFLCAMFAVSQSLNYCTEHPESVCCNNRTLCTWSGVPPISECVADCQQRVESGELTGCVC